MTRLAINGFGRIGRCLLRALVESERQAELKLVAINELADFDTLCHLTKYDSTHGRFPGQVSLRDDCLEVNGKRIRLSGIEVVSKLPWGTMGVDLVFECTGSFSDRATAEEHLAAGASRVLFSQPADRDMDATVVYGVNHAQLGSEQKIVSAASCTTNAIVPVIEVLHRGLGLEWGQIRTLHAAMNDQPVIDAYHHTDLRKTRAAFQSLIPVETGLAAGIERILPELTGRFTASAVRVPVSDVSAIDLSLYLSKTADADEINALLSEAASNQYAGMLGYTEEPLASCDFVHDPRSGVVDANQTQVAGGRLAQLLVWFDNEWGYANRMLDVASAWLSQSEQQALGNPDKC